MEGVIDNGDNSCKDNIDIGMKKALIRKDILRKRAALSPDECRSLSEKICDSFLKSNEYMDAETILLYKAYNNEVDTDMIFDQATLDGKTVCYPVSAIVDGEPELYFYEINDHTQLKIGYKGILEPDTGKVTEPFTGSADICITPGVAFDRKCHRIGYGKAFYDRYIRLNTPEKVIGLAYDIQMADDFETEDSDRTIDMVITESGIYYR